MKRLVLDTSVLLRWWNDRRSRHRGPITTFQAATWGRELAEFFDTNAILTPICLEVVGGVTSAAELRLMEAYLSAFVCLDEGRITSQDWREASRLARRVPRDRQPRQMGDCLIRAVADRLRYEVWTFDKSFPT